MFDAMQKPINVGDTVVIGASGGSAAELLFARVKSVGPKRVVLDPIDHPKTIKDWQTRASRAHADVLVVQL